MPVSDVFLSYASGDRPRVKPLAEALQEHHWSVWWDRSILPGQHFERVIETELANARCVVVVWSRASVASDWVRAEAGKGAKRGILVPVLFDPVEIPLPYSHLQMADLIDWPAVWPKEELQKLVQAISEVLLRPGPPDVPSQAGDDATRGKPKAAQARIKTIKVRVTFEGGDQLEIRFRPSRLHLQKGEMVTFACEQGELDLLLKPADAYRPSRFRTGDGPVQVLKSAKGTIWYGGKFSVGWPLDPAIAIDPSKKQFGAANDPS